MISSVPEELHEEFAQLAKDATTPQKMFDLASLVWAFANGGIDEGPKEREMQFNTTQYTCASCGSKKTHVTTHQNRAGDEGATLLVECPNGHRWAMRQ